MYGLKLDFSIMRFYELFAVGLQEEIEKEEVDDHWRFCCCCCCWIGLWDFQLIFFLFSCFSDFVVLSMEYLLYMQLNRK